jgi:hypothetical protein
MVSILVSPKHYLYTGFTDRFLKKSGNLFTSRCLAVTGQKGTVLEAQDCFDRVNHDIDDDRLFHDGEEADEVHWLSPFRTRR